MIHPKNVKTICLTFGHYYSYIGTELVSRASMCVRGIMLQLAFTSRLLPSSSVAFPKLVVNAIIMHVSCHVHVGHHSLPPLVDSAPHPRMLWTQ